MSTKRKPGVLTADALPAVFGLVAKLNKEQQSVYASLIDCVIEDCGGTVDGESAVKLGEILEYYRHVSPCIPGRHGDA